MVSDHEKNRLFKEAKPTDYSEVRGISAQSHSVLITAKGFIVQAKERTVGQNPFSYNKIQFLTLANSRCYSPGLIKGKNLNCAWQFLKEMITTEGQNSEATTLMMAFMSPKWQPEELLWNPYSLFCLYIVIAILYSLMPFVLILSTL